MSLSRNEIYYISGASLFVVLSVFVGVAVKFKFNPIEAIRDIFCSGSEKRKILDEMREDLREMRENTDKLMQEASRLIQTQSSRDFALKVWDAYTTLSLRLISIEILKLRLYEKLSILSKNNSSILDQKLDITYNRINPANEKIPMILTITIRDINTFAALLENSIKEAQKILQNVQQSIEEKTLSEDAVNTIPRDYLSEVKFNIGEKNLILKIKIGDLIDIVGSFSDCFREKDDVKRDIPQIEGSKIDNIDVVQAEQEDDISKFIDLITNVMKNAVIEEMGEKLELVRFSSQANSLA
jgi:hypothetical protein